MPQRRGFPRSIIDAILPTLRYWTQTEVHAFAFSVAANVLLGFFPFLIVSVSLSRLFFSGQTTVAAIDFALRDYFPDALGEFLSKNLPQRPVTDWVAIVLLLFSSNGIFEPLEVALNKIWGIRKNRGYLHNQVVSLGLIFACGTLALLSLGITELRVGSSTGLRIELWTSVLFFRLAALPLTSL